MLLSRLDAADKLNYILSKIIYGCEKMTGQKMSLEKMEYVIWVIEITAAQFFNGDKTMAYDMLKNSTLWDLYTDNYDTTHTLGSEYILDEINEYFIKNEVIFPC